MNARFEIQSFVAGAGKPPCGPAGPVGLSASEIVPIVPVVKAHFYASTPLFVLYPYANTPSKAQ